MTILLICSGWLLINALLVLLRYRASSRPASRKRGGLRRLLSPSLRHHK